MSLTRTLDNLPHAAGPAKAAPAPKRKRDAPFAIRLSRDERARLEHEAAGTPLGTYIKSRLFGSAPLARMRRTGLAVQDRQALARVLAMLGRSRLSGNLNQLARLAHVGALPMTPETEAELQAALRDIRDMRRLLLMALGLKPEDAAR